MMKRLIGIACLCLATQASATTFAAIGDIGDTPNSRAVANLIKNRSTGYVIGAGDICYATIDIATQVSHNYKTFHDGGRYFAALGNHEYQGTCGSLNAPLDRWISYWSFPNNERYYTKLIGNVQFFFVNSWEGENDGYNATSAQADYIKEKIAASTAKWKVVVFHYPAFSSGRHGSTEYMRWPFEDWGIDAVINGHDHDYERIMRDDNADGVELPYFVSGLGGQSLTGFGVNAIIQGSVKRYSGGYGALFITSSLTSLKFTFIKVGGTVIDTYTIRK